MDNTPLPLTPTTLLLRQVHPAFIQNGRVSSQVFRPTPKDEKKLSVYNGEMIDPEGSWEHFNKQPSCKSLGVVGVLVQECEESGLESYVDPQPFPEHAIISFEKCTGNANIRSKAKKLRNYAENRNWLYFTDN